MCNVVTSGKGDGTWLGWWRPGPKAAWQQLAEADSYDRAWRLLLERRPPRTNGELVVLTEGRHPQDRVAGTRVAIHKPGRSFGLEPAEEPTLPSDVKSEQ